MDLYPQIPKDWLEVEQIANELGDERWSTRASGELGVIAFLEGDSWKAAKLLGAALLSTMANGDEGGEIRFLEMLGNGMEEVNRHSEGLMLFQKAIKLAEADTDSGLPFMAYEGKAKALAALGKPDEAKAMLEDAFAKARSQQKQGHAAQLLIILSKLAAQEGHPQQAIWDLENAGQLTTGIRFYRIEADAMFELAKLYRDSGDLANAESRATQGLIASQLVGDRYYVPRNLTVLADLRARRADIRQFPGSALHQPRQALKQSRFQLLLGQCREEKFGGVHASTWTWQIVEARISEAS